MPEDRFNGQQSGGNVSPKENLPKVKGAERDREKGIARSRIKDAIA
jgi:hypothetical protein